MAKFQQDQLAALMPHCDAPTWIDPLATAMGEFEVNTPQRMAAFLAQIAHESGELRTLEERLSYSAIRLCEVWPKRFPTVEFAKNYARNPEKLANLVYANRMGNGDERSGDGYRYRGRGLIQLTGRSNYRNCAAALGQDFVGNPDLLFKPLSACRSAAWFWKSRGLNDLADHQPGDDDVEDFKEITIRINGGTAGLHERRDYWEHARSILGV